jgi:hypothetical protein
VRFRRRRHVIRNNSRLSALAVGLFLLALPALATDVAGKWTAEFDTQVGPFFERMEKIDEIALTRQVGEFATEQIVARRAKN